MKLYIYDHCPYCVKARMIFGFKNIPVKLSCLSNDDEKTPISMIGVKMVPILEVKRKKFMPESLDIISYIDEKEGKPVVVWDEDEGLADWLNRNSQLCYELAMPRWAQAPLKEFKSQKAKNYFTKKKESYIGPFEDCLKQTEALVKKMDKQLQILESFFEKKQKFFQGSLSVDDFHLFAFLRSLSIVKALSFPENVKYYSEYIAEKSNVPLHHSIAL